MNLNAVPEQYRGMRSFAFGDRPALADELLDLVMKGIKTATCSTEDEPNTSTLAVAERAPTLTLPRKRERGQEKQPT